MQNLENLAVFEILITQNLLKCPKDPFVRSALIYTFILTRSSLGLLHVIFHLLIPELYPLIYAKNSFLFNILITH